MMVKRKEDAVNLRKQQTGVTTLRGSVDTNNVLSVRGTEKDLLQMKGTPGRRKEKGCYDLPGLDRGDYRDSIVIGEMGLELHRPATIEKYDHDSQKVRDSMQSLPSS